MDQNQHLKRRRLEVAPPSQRRDLSLFLHNLEDHHQLTMGLSTHILDTSRGKPAPNVAISLFRGTAGSESWEKAGEGSTDGDGRYKGFFADNPSAFTSGLYKLRFEVGQYYEQLQIDTLYPFVEIVFNIKDASQHYHIPLLLNPFGYSTYRGS